MSRSKDPAMVKEAQKVFKFFATAGLVIAIIIIALVAWWKIYNRINAPKPPHPPRPAATVEKSEKWIFCWKLLPGQPEQTGGVKSMSLPVKDFLKKKTSIFFSLERYDCYSEWVGGRKPGEKYYSGRWNDSIGNSGVFYELEFIAPDYAEGYSKDDQKSSIARIILKLN